MVADLLADELRLPYYTTVIVEGADEKLAKEGIEGLLDAVGFAASAVLLALEATKIPAPLIRRLLGVFVRSSQVRSMIRLQSATQEHCT